MSNFKHQIPMKSQILISNDSNRFVILNFDHCDLFVICYLRFGIFHRNSKVSSSNWRLTARGSAEPLNPEPLPGNKLVELGKHLVDLDPVLQVFGRADVGAFVHHHPAHVRGTVLASRAVPGFRGAAAVHGLKVRSPANEFDQAFRLRLAVVQRQSDRWALVPTESPAQHFAGRDDFVIVFR